MILHHFQEFIALEKEIFRYEHRNVLKKYENKTIFADEIKKTVDQLEATYKELKKQTWVIFGVLKFKVTNSNVSFWLQIQLK